ncbi:hypothetical protein HJC10_18435 [Corallococcus exiguus]|nr:hypothetical protein [Corallococcus exiguus]
MSALESFLAGCVPVVLAALGQGVRLWMKSQAEQAAARLMTAAPTPLPPRTPAPVAEPAPEVSTPPEDTGKPAPGLLKRWSRLLTPTKGGATYAVPHCVLVGTPDADSATLLKSVELPLPFGKPERPQDPTRATAWIFNEGQVIDLPGLTKSAEPSFRSALKSLRGARPLRPIDAAVLALPAALLLGTDRAYREKARAQADAVAKGLRTLQDELGVCFPIYVLFTQAEVLPGFASFCRALPSDMWNEMFGWSNPHPFEAAWRAEWIPEAFERLHGTLTRVQLELLASEEGQNAQERDAAFTFPSALRGLTEPARALLDPIFRASVHHEALPLRGVYFNGDLSANERLTERTLGAPAPGPHPIFLTHLLDQKVFPESSLARPSASEKRRNQRALMALRWSLAVSVVLMPVGLWTLEQRLRGDTRPVAEGMAGLARLSTERAQGAPDAEAERRRAATVLQELAKLPGTPASTLAGQLQDALRVSFEDLVLPTLHRELGTRLQQILDGEVQHPALPDGLLAPEETPEFQALRSLDQELATFTAQVDAFNALQGQSGRKRLETVDGLARYLLHADPGTAFLQNGARYEEALAQASAPRFEASLQEAAPRRATALAAKLSRRLFVENPLEARLSACVALAIRLEGRGGEGTSVARTARELAQALERLRTELARPGAVWLGPPGLGKALTGLLDSVRKSRALGEPAAADMERQWTGELDALKERLCALSTRATGPLLARDDQGCKLELSAGALALEKALKELLAQGFMAEPDAPPPASSKGPVRVFWSEPALDEALRLTKLYEGFLTEGLAAFPGELHEVVAEVARQQLERRLSVQLLRARKLEAMPAGEAATHAPQAESQLAAELANLKQVDGKLRQLRDLGDQLLLISTRQELGDLLASQAGSLLERVDALFERDTLYAPDPRFSRWQGRSPAALEAFGVSDAVALGQYLKTQRTRAATLARDYATLPVSLLWEVSATSERPPLLLKWRRIGDELRDWEQQVPGNSVQALESFVQQGLMNVTREHCLQGLPPAGDAGKDFFLARRASLQGLVARRCDQLVSDQLGESYARLARRFNTTLAGRFPFTTDTVEAPDAALPEVRAFFLALDEVLPLVDAPERRSLSAEALAFLEQARSTRAFLAPLLLDEDEGLAGYGLKLEPRVNVGEERLANQIITWSLVTGGRRLAVGKPGAWHPGEPLQVALRWAKDAPSAPLARGEACGGPRAPDATARFEFGGTWGLLRLLRAQQGRPTDFGGGADPRPHTLRFAIRVEEKRSRLCEQAVAFLRVPLTGLEGKTRFTSPRLWPTRAPSGAPAALTRSSTP